MSMLSVHSANRRRVSFLSLALVCLTGGCAGEQDAPASQAEVVGSVGGESLDGRVMVANVLREAGAPLAPAPNQRLQIYLGEAGAVITAFCPDFAVDTSKVVLLLDIYAASIGPAQYNVCDGFSCEAPYAQANWSGPLNGAFGVDAVSGTVTLTEVGEVATGTFTLMFGTDEVSGQFSAPIGCHDERGEPALDEVCRTAACSTHDYAINVVSFPQVNEDGLLGFDIDQTSATVCGQPDAMSPAPHAHTGVDNAVGPVLASLETGFLQTQINAGETVQLIRVEGVDEFQNDEHVRVTLLVGQASDRFSFTHEAFGHFAPHQTFSAWASSYVDEAHTQPRFSSMEGSIVNGVLLVHAEDAPLLMSIADVAVVGARLDSAQIEVSITPDGLDRGIIGGSIDIPHFVSALSSAPQFSSYVPSYEALLRSVADLNPDGDGTCQSVSLTQAFDAVSASIGGTVVTGR
ncbi:MAG: hypothetical protein IPK60_16165 [Sandaracinaceae bacterium]|jgi:hypothetical protein|nr:hypothetical protein [Sandaracinaceae bacterium]